MFGGKAAGLAWLISAGVGVPEGFAVEATRIAPADWPRAAREALRQSLDALLAGGAIVVRSSAVGEDAPQHSFAGLLETALHVRGLDAALLAVERCLASAGAPRVRAFAPDAALPVGLVVQRQVAPRKAGVVFTADPLGQDRALLIEATSGAGERLVSGHAQPERWRVYRNGLGGVEEQHDGPAQGVLQEFEVERLASVAWSLASRRGHPLDLEWALEGDALHWLQARPITAAGTPIDWVIERFHEGVDDGPISVWSNFNVRETLPLPLSPLNESLWREVVLPGVLEDMLGLPRGSRVARQLGPVDFVHGRLYWNMNALLAGPFGAFFGLALRWLDSRSAEVVERLRAAGVLRPRRLRGLRSALAGAVLRAALLAPLRFVRGLRPSRVLDELRAYAEASRAWPELAALNDAALFSELRVLVAPVSEPLHRGQRMLGLAMFVWALAERAFRPYPRARGLLAAGLPNNPTTAIALGIDALVDAAGPLREVFREAPGPDWRQRIAADAQGPGWLARLELFLAEHGQRCPREFEIAVPRWSEDPRMILELVRAGLAAPQARSATQRLEHAARERADAVAEACRGAPFWKRPLLRLLADLVAQYMPLREAPKHYAMFAFRRMRAAALEIGRRLVARGHLGAVEDVFLLELSEAEASLRHASPDNLAARLAARRERVRRFEVEKPPDVVRSDGVRVEEPLGVESPGVLRGVGASVGIAIGPVRVLERPDPARLYPGEVLVVEFADPGWTPLFPRAAALVMEVGGTLCHAAVVARELGVPAVFGVRGAARRLRDGEMVRVDGARGTVVRLNPPGE